MPRVQRRWRRLLGRHSVRQRRRLPRCCRRARDTEPLVPAVGVHRVPAEGATSAGGGGGHLVRRRRALLHARDYDDRGGGQSRRLALDRRRAAASGRGRLAPAAAHWRQGRHRRPVEGDTDFTLKGYSSQ